MTVNPQRFRSAVYVQLFIYCPLLTEKLTNNLSTLQRMDPVNRLLWSSLCHRQKVNVQTMLYYETNKPEHARK